MGFRLSPGRINHFVRVGSILSKRCTTSRGYGSMICPDCSYTSTEKRTKKIETQTCCILSNLIIRIFVQVGDPGAWRRGRPSKDTGTPARHCFQLHASAAPRGRGRQGLPHVHGPCRNSCEWLRGTKRFSVHDLIRFALLNDRPNHMARIRNQKWTSPILIHDCNASASTCSAAKPVQSSGAALGTSGRPDLASKSRTSHGS